LANDVFHHDALIKTLQKRPLLNSGVQSKSGAGKRNVDNWLDFNQKLLNGDHVVAPTKVLSSHSSTKAVNSSRKQSLEMSGAIKHLESANACGGVHGQASNNDSKMFERTGFETRCQGNEKIGGRSVPPQRAHDVSW
jgi:hypothetical protein